MHAGKSLTRAAVLALPLISTTSAGNRIGAFAYAILEDPSVVPARSAVALGMPDPDHVYTQGAAVPGDSGSAVIPGDGRAVGMLVTVGVHTDGAGASTPDACTVGITRLTPQLRRGERVLGVDLVLREAPLQLGTRRIRAAARPRWSAVPHRRRRMSHGNALATS